MGVTRDSGVDSSLDGELKVDSSNQKPTTSEKTETENQAAVPSNPQEVQQQQQPEKPEVPQKSPAKQVPAKVPVKARQAQKKLSSSSSTTVVPIQNTQPNIEATA